MPLFDLPPLELNEVIAWALIAGGFAYWAARTLGPSAAAVTAALVALAVKSALFEAS
ncbi:hypothetical protein JYK14_10925 [Siccirubricoccus sp. KC 17139]|uniref:Uncharacterized protein n=1 Tax=Siccirubricoccus soli TaxID=2899147 RepID=A0ABT1D636_9PROT|nr:hypothetical protein [Siccirubricoccus soli]MCO6416669.1 hypothetical protein [Siccirubricoccus soli]MCP2682804.1 hypothetical protein [Siccirubricoccus soli]